MDVRSLQFEAESFDVAIDKGTMDAMLAVKGSLWDPPTEAVENCKKEVREAIRVLKNASGVFLYLTFGQPHFRKRYLQYSDPGESNYNPKTSLEVRELGDNDSFHYYAYILRKTR